MNNIFHNNKSSNTIFTHNGILSTDSEGELETESESWTDSGFESINKPSPVDDSFNTRDGKYDANNDTLKKNFLFGSKNEVSFHDDCCSDYMSFTDANPTTYHVISHFIELLKTSGFESKPESSTFGSMKGGGAFFTTRGSQAMVAFIVGGKWIPENGLEGIGCHVDALTIKLKPYSVKETICGYELLGVAPYSGALNHLWLDRDLGIAGTIVVRDKHSKKRIETKLISSGRHAICRIPSLAPHFGRAADLPYNKESKMIPVMGFATSEPPATKEEKSSMLYGKHSLSLLRYLARLAGVNVSQIISVDLDLYDVQVAARGGLSNEFLFAPRIDDRLCAYSAINALIRHTEKIDLTEYDGLHVVLLANNEEIGSATRTGAKGKLLNSVIERVLISRGCISSELPLVFANSIILSADVTHALNPNFVEEYLEDHFPVPNKGLVLKLDVNGHVMTDSMGIYLMSRISKKSHLALQQFHIRNDKPSGGTIGPMLAVDTGARVIDVGLAQLSMHSIRACAGYKEPGIGVLTFEAFFRHCRAVVKEMGHV